MIFQRKLNAHTLSLTKMNRTTLRQYLTKLCKDVSAVSKQHLFMAAEDLAELAETSAVLKQCVILGPF